MKCNHKSHQIIISTDNCTTHRDGSTPGLSLSSDKKNNLLIIINLKIDLIFLK